MGLLDVLNGMQNGPRGSAIRTKAVAECRRSQWRSWPFLLTRQSNISAAAPSRARNYRKRDLRLRRPYQEQQLQALEAALPVGFLVG